MMDVRIGIIGSTHGVKASSRPKPKNDATTVQTLALVMMLAFLSWSDRGGRMSARSVIAVASGRLTVRVLVVGG